MILGCEGTQIMFDFTVIECDQELMQALINCAAGTLMQSRFQLKCIPIGVCIMIKKDSKEFEADPNVK